MCLRNRYSTGPCEGCEFTATCTVIGFVFGNEKIDSDKSRAGKIGSEAGPYSCGLGQNKPGRPRENRVRGGSAERSREYRKTHAAQIAERRRDRYYKNRESILAAKREQYYAKKEAAG